MRTFTLQQSRTEVYTPNGGLALVGHCLNRHTSLTKTARTVAKLPRARSLTDEPGLRRIVKVTVRTSDAEGQLYLEPEVSLEGWTTSLPVNVADEQQVVTRKLCRGNRLLSEYQPPFKI